MERNLIISRYYRQTLFNSVREQIYLMYPDIVCTFYNFDFCEFLRNF